MAKKSNEIAQLGKTHEKAERIRNAVTAYNRDPNLSMRDAATIFKCSPQSVSNHVKQQNDQANSSDPMMHLPDAYVDLQLLTPGEEASLIQHIKCCSDSGLALTKILLFGFVHELLKQNGRDRSVGKKWHLRFYKRHPDVEAKYCRPMEKARVVNENAAEYIEWFQQVFKTIIEWDIQLADTWNMDESGAGIGIANKSYVIVRANEKDANHVHNANREWATLIETINAIGQAMMPFSSSKGQGFLKIIKIL